MGTELPRQEASGSTAARLSALPSAADWAVIGPLALGFAVLYLPTYASLARTIWATDEQGHGPIILSVSAWLLFKLRHDVAALQPSPALWRGWICIVLGLLLYAFGRSQDIIIFEVGSQIFLIAGLLLLFKGPSALRLAWFPLFFLVFMIPLPGALVAALTTPLKSAVSAVAEAVLYHTGYPIARAGVVLSVGPYQLLVADACAGLNSMFTLEALGLLYMNLMAYTSPARNLILAVLIIPISFLANVVRVMILVLVTYHFGDEAGQGFIHGFAGIVLFMVGLILMLGTDKVIGAWIGTEPRST